MRHSYEPDLTLLETAGDALEYFGAGTSGDQLALFKKTIDLVANATGPDNLPARFQAPALLKELGSDHQTLIAALLGGSTARHAISLEDLGSGYSAAQMRLIKNVRWLNSFSVAENLSPHTSIEGDLQAERVRQLILVMVEDVRALLVKLAFRVYKIKKLLRTPTADTRAIARDTLDVYAPLANRLGVAQLKWQLEDLSFRLLEPDAYMRIAKSLEERREDREKYIGDFVVALENKLREGGHGSISVLGRPKHLYSIWSKIQRKRVEVSDLFDVRAVRVLVDTVQECYAVLGIVHSNWQHLPGEFDDYIANTKENGYQSLHTAIVGPQGKAVEIQIRTHVMNEEAELGIAAHWRYKEGGSEDTRLQRSINSLRSLLDSKEVNDEHLLEAFSTDVFADRVYVFTPTGEVVDLPAKSTPLDFAYHVHTEIGHRCRGAKVNGRIVQLGHTLGNGDQVEILTGKLANPSRDWMNKSLGFLQTSRGRGKVRSWFNVRDKESHFDDGKAIVDRELKRLNAREVDAAALSGKLNLENTESLYISIGRGAISHSKVATAINALLAPELRVNDIPRKRKPRRLQGDAIEVAGVGSLLTQMAACCNPVPYDSIVGFITRGKGVTVHRRDCNNILNLRSHEQTRLVEVDWGGESIGEYLAGVQLVAFDRQGLLRDITSAITNEGVTVSALNTRTDDSDLTAHMSITVNINSIEQLVNLMEKLRQLPNVISVERLAELSSGG